MGCLFSKPATPEAPMHYISPGTNNTVITFKPSQRHSRKDELSYVNTEDVPFSPNEECYLINAQWLDQWFAYCSWTNKTGQPKRPSHIPNYELIEQNTGSLKIYKELKTDFRPIKKKVWEYLFKIYGGSPVIYFIVPDGFEEKAYKKGTWIKHVKIPDCIQLIYPSTTFPRRTESSSVNVNPMLTMSVVYAMQEDVGASKLRQGLALQKDINEAVAESVGAMFAKELGKQKFAEAEKMEEQVTEEKATAVATIFVDDLAESKKREALRKEAEEHAAQEERIMESLRGAGAKKRFRAFLAAGKTKEAETEAANMLKNAWRCKLARRQVEKKRKEKERLREEAAAIKLQGRWRIRQSKAKVCRLKAEQQRLREEGAAIMLQSAWRIRKANEKVKRLKAEKQRLMEEGAAMMFQCAWRRRQARRKVDGLRTQKRVESVAREKISHFVVGYIARLKYMRRKRLATQVILLTLTSAEGLNVADITGASDPYVYIQGINLPRADGAVSVPNPAAGKSSRNVLSQGKSACLYKSQVVYKNLNPAWNETCMIPNVNGYDDITLTICDYDMVGAHDFLGQAVVHLSDYDKIFKGKPVTMTLPLKGYTVPVRDIHEKDLTLGETDATGKGSITFSLSILPTTIYVHCGWLSKMSKGALGMGFGAEYKPRYFILTRERLAYYADSHSIELHPKGVLECDAVTNISIVVDSKTGAQHLSLVAGKEHWEVRFLEESGRSLGATQEVWLRKLHSCCRNAPKTHAPPLQANASLKSAAMASPAATAKSSKRSSLFGNK